MNLAGVALRGPAAEKSELMIPAELRLGEYFAKKEYTPEPLPTFDAIKDRLPEPVIDGHADWLPMSWKCWQLAFAHLKKPASGSPLVSNWLDEWFSSKHFPVGYMLYDDVRPLRPRGVPLHPILG